jgi:hypothetical protein
VRTGQESWSAAAGSSVAALVFSPDGRLVAAGTYDGAVILKEAETGREVRRLSGPGGTARAVGISSNGVLLAVSGDTTAVLVYEVATGKLVRRLDGHRGSVWALAFAPDGRSLVTGSFDATALVWDLTWREAERRPRGPLTAADLELFWTRLGDAEADGYDAVLALALAPQQAVPFLQQRLGGGGPDARTIARWLADLDDDDFEVREAATRALAAQGRDIETELRKARREAKSPEAQRRLEELLKKLDGGRKAANERLRGLRAVTALELAATPEAREALRRLADRATDEELRRQARGALDRSAKRQ